MFPCTAVDTDHNREREVGELKLEPGTEEDKPKPKGNSSPVEDGTKFEVLTTKYNARQYFI